MPPTDFDPTGPHAQLRQPWLPAAPKVVFITEAPPPIDSGRYFYRPFVPKGDSLFLETIKILFPEEVDTFDTVKQLRKEKPYFLGRLRDEGYLLTHASMIPMPGTTTAQRRNLYLAALPALIAHLFKLGVKPKTPIFIISAVVYEAIAAQLRGTGFNLPQPRSIEYPNSGQQANFRKRLQPLLANLHLLPKPL